MEGMGQVGEEEVTEEREEVERVGGKEERKEGGREGRKGVGREVRKDG